jgi:tRNA modification GTPase
MTADHVATVVVELTPPGRGAVAVILVDGPKALEAIRQFYLPVTCWDASGPAIGRILLGRWGGEQGEEVVVCRRGEQQFEIHCHGGLAAAPAIVGQLAGAGCVTMSWREWSRSPRGIAASMGAGATRKNATMGAALAALAEATSARTAAVLLDQYHGALSAAVDGAREALAAADAARAAQILDGVLVFREVGLHLTSPWRVVIAGAPNVGKSSLINAIAGYHRAIVSPLPGTTRDVVTITTAIDGWPVQIADTAGLRETHNDLELAGVALTGAALQRAELVIVVVDATAKNRDEKELVNRLAAGTRVIVAVNKIDLVDWGRDAPRVTSNSANGEVNYQSQNTQFVSALTGQGISELLVAIERWLVPMAPPAGAAVAFTASQVAGLEAARAAIEECNPKSADEALTAVLASGNDA